MNLSDFLNMLPEHEQNAINDRAEYLAGNVLATSIANSIVRFAEENETVKDIVLRNANFILNKPDGMDMAITTMMEALFPCSND